MRVIAGKAGGHRLVAPTGRTTRPTSDRAKEALFSILGSAGILETDSVLDLFAGSGALGIEALSRGVAHATFIEKSRQAIESIRKNLQKTGFTQQSTVMCQDILTAIDFLTRQKASFGLILIDPPYASDLYDKVIVASAPLLRKTGVLVAETSSRVRLPDSTGGLEQFETRVYGDTSVVFYRLEGSDAG